MRKNCLELVSVLSIGYYGVTAVTTTDHVWCFADGSMAMSKTRKDNSQRRKRIRFSEPNLPEVLYTYK